MIACRATGCLLGLWREQAVGRYARRCADGLSPRIDRDSCRLDGVGRRTCARRSAVAMMLDRGPGERVVKYIASVLLLLFSALVRLPVSSASSSSTYRVDAWFQEIDTTGVSTDLSIVVEQHATATNVRLAVDRTSPACDRDPHDCPADMISAYTNTLVGAGDFVAAPDLFWATLHTTVDVTDSRSGQRAAIRIDLDWTAAGDRSSVDGAPSMELVDESVRGAVASSLTDYLAGSSLWSATMARS